MKPVFCQVKHDPDAGTFGDCVRACIASLLELGPGAVPHFYHDSCDGETGHTRIREWLATRGLVPFYAYYNGNDPLETVLEHMNTVNPGVHYMLYGNTGESDHVVVCCGNKIVHDPAWVPTDFVAANSTGYWSVMVIAVK
ncbi:hypothetical protein EOA32_01030 [Mesorhizobium sp. M1A.F.Ca.ET.072.01.1.1]|uniref:hypothetical protein n=1 Tax=Mesorhizobium sp. M1A.F.Ca.ET.072.01.1.1 TaxID=2496753 RepID=UPI000FD5C5B7|nr:hypothetical protein [Mesorhizobium sp. M1A.F.Ca.ET.072.01.1.1]RUW55633.1 hypothetical protein EOA32_01030 [Mesorhizobium sp. M1A.F.Ca.ET.072.01.1.1]